MQENIPERSILAQIQPQCEEVYKRIKSEKKRQNRTAQEIADATGIPISSVNKYLSGKTSNVNLYYTAAACIYFGISLDELFGISPPSNKDAEQTAALAAHLHELERELEYCRKDREHLIASLNSRKIIITVLFGICILLISSFSIGVIYDSMLPHDGFIKNGRIAWISALLISVIVVAIAVTVSIMSRYFYRQESRLKNAEKKKRN